MLFYARDSGFKTLEEITTLNLQGKNLLTLNNLDFLKKLTNLRHLDISENIDMYKPYEMLRAEAIKAAEGSNVDPETVDFITNIQHRDVLLHNIPSVEHLVCDIMLEAYIGDTRPHRHFLPKLQSINRLPLAPIDLGLRRTEKRILEIMDKMWAFVGTYRLVKPGKMDEEPTFYINDEVGNSISHNDKPNCKLCPFIYSPNCEADDVKTTTFSIMWPIEDIQKENYIYRDFLSGIDETKWRSARLCPWFNVYEEYYAEEYKKFTDFKPAFDALKLHEQYQTDYPAPSNIDWDIEAQGPIPVYSDYDVVCNSLKDPRFKITTNPEEAKILYLYEDYESRNFMNWKIDFSKVHVNFFKMEGAIVTKNGIANLINTTLVDKSCI